MEFVFVIVGVIWLWAYVHRASKRAGRRINRHFKPRDNRFRRNGTSYAKTAEPLPEQTVIFGAPYVVDGDSLVIQKTQIRLFGVDAPELNHPYGIRAKQKLWALCKGHSIRAEVLSTDVHGRTVALCYLPDGCDLSAEMVKAGLAIDWAKFSGGIYRDLEVPDARRKMWLADARQKGRMHVWEQFDAKHAAKRAET